MVEGHNVPEDNQIHVTSQTSTTSSVSPSQRYVESVRALLVAIALTGSITLAIKYQEALTPTLVILGGVIGGYFGVSQNSKMPPT